MAKKGEVNKCEICGDIVCCGEEHELVSESEAKDFLAGLPKIGVI